MVFNGIKTKCKPDQTILVSIEEANLSIDSHCKSGYCGVCRCKLIKGNVIYKVEPLASVNAGEVISCVAYANDDIEIVTS